MPEVLWPGIFTLGNLLAAVSDSYAMLLAVRILTSFNHGAFFGVGSIVAAGLVPPQRRAGAVAAMFMGLTIANVVGVPLATWVGEHLGWRASFWGIAGLGVATMAALRLTLPELPAPAGSNAMAELRALTRGPVLGALALMSAASDAPNLASAVNIGAFNLGNAFGAALGGGVIAAGLGYPMVALAGAATSAIGLLAVLIGARTRAAETAAPLCESGNR